MADEARSAEGTPADVITSVGESSLAEAGARRLRFATRKMRKSALDAASKRIKRELDELEALLLDDYAELGTDKMNVDARGVRQSLYLAPDVWARPLKTGVDDRGNETSTDEDWAKAVDALRAAGLGDYVQERFNVQSLSSWLREFREAHGPNWREQLPDEFDGAIEITDRMQIRMRKA